MTRRTKIVATLGPAAAEAPDVLRALILAGVDVVRINLSHGTLDDGIERYRRLRRVEEAMGRPLGILADLPGPKVRAGTFPDGGAHLATERHVASCRATSRATPSASTSTTPAAPGHARRRPLVFGDGGVVVQVIDAGRDSAPGPGAPGAAPGPPGRPHPSERLRRPPPRPTTSTPRRLRHRGGRHGPRGVVRALGPDIRRGTRAPPGRPQVIAKVETRAAVENLEGIIEAAGAVMVARGDLGAEMPLEELPHSRRRSSTAASPGVPAITATQMLESMVSPPSPTRAETSDIANAVFDGTEH